MTIKPGEHLPAATFRAVTADAAKPVTTDDVFKGRKVVLFGVPGAFTPTCHKNHLPGFLAHAAEIKARGVDAIAVTSINDAHVFKAWALETGAMGTIEFLADGNGEFAKAAGLTFDASAGGMGIRSLRYSMVVENGVVLALNIEDAPGKADISGAAALMKDL